MMPAEIRGGERIIDRASDTDREMSFSSRIFNVYHLINRDKSPVNV